MREFLLSVRRDSLTFFSIINPTNELSLIGFSVFVSNRKKAREKALSESFLVEALTFENKVDHTCRWEKNQFEC